MWTGHLWSAHCTELRHHSQCPPQWRQPGRYVHYFSCAAGISFWRKRSGFILQNILPAEWLSEWLTWSALPAALTSGLSQKVFFCQGVLSLATALVLLLAGKMTWQQSWVKPWPSEGGGKPEGSLQMCYKWKKQCAPLLAEAVDKQLLRSPPLLVQDFCPACLWL